jgi:hypothetical protein
MRIGAEILHKFWEKMDYVIMLVRARKHIVGDRETIASATYALLAHWGIVFTMMGCADDKF